mmetsp:Transcript_14113/g.29850  ORF Transcript_14113/g.29850 Transcript_14113/m.29850 type:complete len:91 (+) Transcript_14113:779-1051(+)
MQRNAMQQTKTKRNETKPNSNAPSTTAIHVVVDPARNKDLLSAPGIPCRTFYCALPYRTYLYLVGDKGFCAHRDVQSVRDIHVFNTTTIL